VVQNPRKYEHCTLVMKVTFGLDSKRDAVYLTEESIAMTKAPVRKTVAVYVRVSTVGQNEAGQKAEIQRWLDNHALHGTVKWFIDKGKSANNLNRPAFASLQQAIFDGDCDTVIVYKLDRISRRLRDGINVLCDWCERGIRVVSVTQNFELRDSMGKFTAHLLMLIAEFEQETRRERQAAGIQVAKKAGKYKGRKPGTTKTDPTRAQALRDKGLTVIEIAKALGVSRKTVFLYLKATRAA